MTKLKFIITMVLTTQPIHLLPCYPWSHPGLSPDPNIPYPQITTLLPHHMFWKLHRALVVLIFVQLLIDLLCWWSSNWKLEKMELLSLEYGEWGNLEELHIFACWWSKEELDNQIYPEPSLKFHWAVQVYTAWPSIRPLFLHSKHLRRQSDHFWFDTWKKHHEVLNTQYQFFPNEDSSFLSSFHEPFLNRLAPWMDLSACWYP